MVSNDAWTEGGKKNLNSFLKSEFRKGKNIRNEGLQPRHSKFIKVTSEEKKKKSKLFLCLLGRHQWRGRPLDNF